MTLCSEKTVGPARRSPDARRSAASRAAALLTLALLAAVPAIAPPAAAQAVDFAAKPLQSERDRAFDALHYRIVLALDLDAKSFEGRTTVTFASLRDGLSECVLDAEEFTVAGVRDEWGAPLAFEQTEREVRIALPRPLEFGETMSVTCAYAGRDPKIGLRFYEETADHPRLVASDSFPDHVHHWFPCFDFPNDKAASELIATVPAGLKVASNGRLVSVVEDAAAGTSTWHWSQELPHSTYLIVLAAGPYTVVRDSCGTVPLNYWVYPRDESKALTTYGKTPRMMEFFNRIFGYDYPWAKYDQISVPFGGGAESTTATVMGHRIMIDETAEPDYSSIGIVSHELAHQWWGDLVTLRTWAHAWMNEGFGTYSDYLYHRHEKGDDDGAVNLRGKLDAYLREAKTRYIRPIVSDRYDRPQDLFDSHSYPKGALVLHMLRGLVGDEAFFATLKHFLHRHAFQPVDTHDFIRAVKTVTGRNLDWFFDQWVSRPGHPVFRVESDWDPAAREVRLRVAQVQDFARDIPVFRVPVTVAVVTDAGRETHRIRIREREETFALPAASRPRLVRFDADNSLVMELDFPRPLDELFYQLRHDDVIGRMQAADGLLRFKDDPAAGRALAAALREDPFWAVRRAAATALAGTGASAAAEHLRRAALDPNSMVRTAALAALGTFGDRAQAGFFRDRFAKDTSYAARAEALRALGQTGDRGAIPFLREAAETPSHRNVIRDAALAALKRLESETPPILWPR